MPEQRIMDVIRPLMLQLKEAENFAAKNKNYNSVPTNVSSRDKVIEYVNEEICCVAEIFRQLEIWEKDMKDKFGDIAKDLAEAMEPDDDNSKFDSKLLSAKEKTSDFKGIMTRHDSPLRLEQLEAYVESVSHATPSLDIPSNQISTDELQLNLSEDAINYITQSTGEFTQILVFLSIFPRGYLIKKTLIYYWYVGDRFGANVDELRLDEYLEVLAQWGIIKCTYKEYKPNVIDCCLINPVVCEALIKLINDGYPHLRAIPEAIYDPISVRPFLSLSQEPNDQGMWESRSRDAFVYGGTCFNIDRSCLKFKRENIEAIKESAVVMLGRWHSSVKHHIEVENTAFLKWLGSFKLLTYLSLRGISRITELPPEICELRTLQILDLRACYDLQRLPSNIRNLRSLQHLDTSECYFLSHMPWGIGDLFELKVLKGFVVGSPQKINEPCSLGSLYDLDRLTKLSISMRRDSVVAEMEFNVLRELTSLVSLTITWAPSKLSSSSGDLAFSRDSSWTELDVSPPPNLEKLDLRCIPQKTLPQWLHPDKVTNLKRLYIRGGRLSVPAFHGSNLTWPSVKVLRLRFLKEGVTPVHRAFPSLDYLEFHECDEVKHDHWTRHGHSGPTEGSVADFVQKLISERDAPKVSR